MERNQQTPTVNAVLNGNKTQTPIVCIGLSAGGVLPLLELFQTLDSTTGAAFVIIHHLRREHPTHLVPILSSCTRMPVQLAANGVPILPNHVYVLPSGEEIAMNDGTFNVQARSQIFGWPNLVSVFIDSMSRSQHPGAAVILSGMDSNGAKALMHLKQHGGVIIAQSPLTADSPDMPRAAIRTGTVDYILDPPEIGRMLTSLAKKGALISNN